MIAGVSWAWWLGFHAVVAAVLVADSLLPGRRGQSRHEKTFIWLGIAGLVLAAAGFACWIGIAMGRQTALEFVTGYAIEASLSVDNLFVFLVLFQAFEIGAKRQHAGIAVGHLGRVCAAGIVYRRGHCAAAAIRVDHVGLRFAAAVCGVADCAQRLATGSDSGMDCAHGTGEELPGAGDLGGGIDGPAVCYGFDSGRAVGDA